MKPIETSEHPAAQPPGQRFQACYREAFGVWMRLLNEEYLKAAFTRREDAVAYANNNPSGGHRSEIKRMWVLINETAGETYALSSSHTRLHAVDLDFSHKSKIGLLRQAALEKLTDEELQALGLSRH